MTSAARVLITNDDGISSPGLQALTEALSRIHEVIVAAPSSDMSGSGTGVGRIDIGTGVDLTPVEMEHTDSAYSIDGPPGLAVTAAALGAFGPLPDLVVSGINAGINTGHSVIHSGTVGAVLTAHTFDMKGLAVSVAQSDPWRWDTASAAAPSIVAWMLDRKGSPHVLNVNVPAVPIDEIAGAHWADLDEFGYFRVATADFDDGRLQFVVGADEQASDPGTDTYLLDAGYITLTPLSTIEPTAFPDVPAGEICQLPARVSG